MSKLRELYDIAATLIDETDKAYRITDGTVTAWIPKSQCEKNDDGTFTIPVWLAKEKSLI